MGCREATVEKAEQQIIDQLTEIGKPFVIVLNSTTPHSAETMHLQNALTQKYDVPVIPTAIQHMQLNDVMLILQEALFEFNVNEIQVEKPEWLDVLDDTHHLNETLAFATAQLQDDSMKIRDVEATESTASRNRFCRKLHR